MKTTSAVILIALGTVFLLDNFNVFPFDIWNELWKLWPVVLILLGVKALLGGGRNDE